MKNFEEKIPEKLTGRLKKCLNFSGNITNKKILNIGCSFGWFEKFAAKEQCREIIGIDINGENISKARNSINDNRVTFIQGDALNLTRFKGEYFDIVTIFDVIEHLPKNSEKELFKQVYRILKINGKLVISTPYACFLSNILDPAWYFGHRHYSLRKILPWLKQEGFEIDSIEIKGGFNELISMIIFYFFKWVFKKEMPLKNYLNKKRDYEYNKQIENGFVTLFIGAVSK